MLWPLPTDNDPASWALRAETWQHEDVLLGDNGIASRHLALSPLSEAFDLTADVLHQRFVKHAPALAAQAASEAMRQARLSVDRIDAVLISTCTGYLCPGLTSYVSEILGLRADVLGLDLVGQGCGAALPNLRTSFSHASYSGVPTVGI